MTDHTDTSAFVMIDRGADPDAPEDKALSFNDRLSAARNFLADEQYADARVLIQEALRLKPNDPLCRAMLGHCIAALDPCSVESLPLCEAAARESRRPEVLLHLGQVYLLQENRRKAIQIFEEGLRADPRYLPIHKELDRIGRRKEPPIRFLPRDHVLNVRLGRWLAARGKR